MTCARPWTAVTAALVSACLSCAAVAAERPPAPPRGDVATPLLGNLEFIDTSFENASPVWYEAAADGTIEVHLLYDHERAAPNRAAGHIHFLINASPGSALTLEFKNMDNIWNGHHGSVARELKVLFISQNGRDWRPLPTEALPGNRIRLTVEMPGPKLYVARLFAVECQL